VISLSPTGRALFENTRRAGDEWLTRALAEHYTEAERQTLITALALLERIT